MVIPSLESWDLRPRAAALENVHLLYERVVKLDCKKIGEREPDALPMR